MSHNIDKIFYINLDKRTDRREEIEKELETFELPYERFPAFYNQMGIAGCTKSHLSVIKLAKERGYKNILIFEDDFMFLISKEELEEQLTEFFNLNINYDICMLAFDHQKEPININNEINVVKRIVETQSASAYIVNQNYYDVLIKLYERALPLLIETGHHWIYANDQVWKSLQKTDIWLSFNKRLGRQRPSFSDNAQCFMDYGK